MMDYIAMGRRIRALRKRIGMTQGELAKECGISTSFMGHLERGTRIASLETLLKISRHLEVSTDYLITGEVDMNTMAAGNQTTKMRMLNDIMRVLNTYSDEWLRAE